MSSQRPYASPRRNLADTAESVQLLWQSIGPDYGGGELHSLEREELHELDADAGIDFVQYLPSRQRRTWASRFQWGPNWYSSFSIRYYRTTGRPTEFSKRLAAYRGSALRPDYTLQGYLDNRPPFGMPIAAATVPTDDLYGFIDSPAFSRNFERWSTGKQYRVRGDKRAAQPLPWCGYRTLRDGTVFLFLTWDLLHHEGVRVRVHNFRPTQELLFDPVTVGA